MKKEISIEKIVIKIGEKTFELTPEEVKDLKFQLDGFMGAKEYVPYYPLTIPYIIPSCPPEPCYPPYEITWCGDVAGGTYTPDWDIQRSYTTN